MSVLGGNPLLLGSGDAAGFTTQRSVRLRSSNSAYFNRTPASAGNRRTWTWSAWVKRGQLGTTSVALFALPTIGGVLYDAIGFNSDALRYVATDNGSTFATELNTTPVFRDPSAWYHIVCAVDTTQAININRIKFYVNGIQITAFSTATYPSQNRDTAFNSANEHRLGRWISSYEDCYLSEVNFIDGQALTPSAFGEYDSVRNTQWKPKRYTGTYGTNGFYLNFSDNSNNTAATIGKDSSGNSNNWTPNGISVTAGVTYDSMTDVPTLTSATAANFATLNPLFGSSGTLGNTNLSLTASASNPQRIGTIGVSSGKWYYEVTLTSLPAGSDPIAGFTDINNTSAVSQYVGQASSSYAIYTISTNSFLQKLNNATFTNTNTGVAAQGNIISVALDLDNNKIWFAKNGTWVDSGDPAAGTNSQFTVTAGTYVPAFRASGGGTASTIDANFGQRPFSYTPPTGFKSLNTYNLPDGNVTSSDDYHKIYTYTGNGGGLQVGEIQKPASLFNLDRSLRFRGSASAYFNRTPASAGNLQISTLSFWVKRGSLSSRQALFSWSGVSSANNHSVEFFSDDTIEIYAVGTAAAMDVKSTQAIKDPNAWTHILYAIDTTQATPANRIKLYINGVQATAFATASYPTQNASLQINSTNPVNIARRVDNTGASFFDGYLADVYFIDGQALAATDFGTYDGNYYWTPKAYTGTYGTNGFHLDFEDFSAATAAAIGKDTSGNGNNWTPNNINLTTPANTNASWDSMVDVPTLTSTDVANFATLNPLTGSNIGSGNLQVTGSGAGDSHTSTIALPTTGKWYAEMSSTAYNASTIVGWFGVANRSGGNFSGLLSRVTGAGGGYVTNDVVTTAANVGALNNVFGVAVDMDAGTVRIYIDGVLQATTVSITPNVEMFFYYGTYTSGTGWVNFGQRPFKYSNYGVDRPAVTFKALNSFNVAEVLGDVESPDFVWIKSRSAATHHALFNSVVGVGKYLQSSNAVVEVTDVNSLIQFNKNGFLLGNAAIVNTLNATYSASVWKVSATTVTNTAGTISSQVRANTTSGISIVGWVGNNTNNSTIGHGLTSLVPKVILAKRRDVTGSNWIAMHSGLAADNNLFLSGTGLTQAISAISGGGISTTVSNTTFTVKQGTTDQSNVNASGINYVAYCFAEIAGFSKFTSYSANSSSTDGPFVYCGFQPRWLMIKRATGASGTGGWIMYDTARDRYNVMSEYLFAESSSGLGTLAAIDTTSNGFKIRTNNVHINQTTNDVYIVMAFAEHPFKYALAR